MELLNQINKYVIIRAIIALIFGLIAVIYPLQVFRTLIVFFGVFVIAEGILSILSATSTKWVSKVISGVISILFGIIVFVYPGLAGLALIYLIAFWAVVTGIFEIAAALKLRKYIEGEIMLILAGVLSILFGILLFSFPASGALSLMIIFGIYLLASSIFLFAFAYRIKKFHDMSKTG